MDGESISVINEEAGLRSRLEVLSCVVVCQREKCTSYGHEKCTSGK